MTLATCQFNSLPRLRDGENSQSGTEQYLKRRAAATVRSRWNLGYAGKVSSADVWISRVGSRRAAVLSPVKFDAGHQNAPEPPKTHTPIQQQRPRCLTPPISQPHTRRATQTCYLQRPSHAAPSACKTGVFWKARQRPPPSRCLWPQRATRSRSAQLSAAAGHRAGATTHTAAAAAAAAGGEGAGQQIRRLSPPPRRSVPLTGHACCRTGSRGATVSSWPALGRHIDQPGRAWPPVGAVRWLLVQPPVVRAARRADRGRQVFAAARQHARQWSIVVGGRSGPTHGHTGRHRARLSTGRRRRSRATYLCRHNTAQPLRPHSSRSSRTAVVSYRATLTQTHPSSTAWNATEAAARCQARRCRPSRPSPQ